MTIWHLVMSDEKVALKLELIVLQTQTEMFENLAL